MNDTEVVRELSRRTALPEATAGAVFHALRQLVQDGVIAGDILHAGSSTAARPQVALATADHADPTLVDDLIARAKRHPLGLGFLLTGLLGSVAIALGAHAFTVEAARERLRKEQINDEKEITPS